MSDTNILKSPWGELTMDPEVANRFDRLDDTHGKMFDLLRDQAEKFNQHRVESTQCRTAFDARIANLEGTIERRSALKSGTVMAGIGALAGAVAAAIGKKTGLWLIPFALILAGCGVTDGGKAANHQNIGAGEALEKYGDPDVAAIGADIRLNAEQVRKEIGDPKQPKPYSSENSAAARLSSQSALDARAAWWNLLDIGLGAAAGLAGLGAAWTWVKKVRIDKILTSVVKGIEDFTSKQPPEIAVKAKDAILDRALEAKVSDPLKVVVDANTKAP